MSRGSIRRRGKSSWEIKFDVPTNDGRRKTRYVTVRGRRADAQRELTRLLSQADAGTLVEPTRITVADYLRTWLDSAEVQPKTRERYKQLAEQQIIPHLGTVPIQRLRPAAIRDWHKTLIASGGKDGRPLAARTVGHAHRVLHAALQAGVADETLSRNVASVISPPKVEEEEVEILEPGAIAVVLAKLRDHALGPLAATALATGARRGELLALAWSCVNLEKASLRIERALEQTKAGLRFKPPKTKHGRRIIALPASAVTVLREHRRRQLELRLQLGLGKPEDDALVFCRFDGSPIPPNDVSRDWRRTCIALGLPRVSFHALRHTHASALIAAGRDVVSISRRLGHGSPAVTLRIYAHLFNARDEQAAETIDTLMRLDGGAR